MKEINKTIENALGAVILLSSFLSALDKEQLNEAKKWQKKK
jgi:hypothetical protein